MMLIEGFSFTAHVVKANSSFVALSFSSSLMQIMPKVAAEWCNERCQT